jgi:putative transposase
VRKLRRADELTAAGKTGEEIAAELGVSPATLYNWRRTYGGMDTDAAKELKELREQNSRLKRLLAEAELEKDALREVATGTVCSRPVWSSATSRRNTITDTATRRWATTRRPSTLRRAGTPTQRWPAISTESGSNKPTLKPGGLSNGDSSRRRCHRG